MSAPEEKRLTDYEKYIRTEELFALQKPKAQRVNRDELIFQAVHQASELMMSVVIEEAAQVLGLIEAGKLGEAAHYTRRMATILEQLGRHISILETMAPADYHVIRLTALGRGSGQESPGFIAILGLGAPLWAAYEKALAASGLDLLGLFRTPRAAWELWLLTQGLLALDEGFQSFRFAHFALVKRIIGIEVKSLKNVPAAQLAHGMQETFFPQLWSTVNVLTRETRPGY